jgi:hypothetical protein
MMAPVETPHVRRLPTPEVLHVILGRRLHRRPLLTADHQE